MQSTSRQAGPGTVRVSGVVSGTARAAAYLRTPIAVGERVNLVPPPAAARSRARSGRDGAAGGSRSSGSLFPRSSTSNTPAGSQGENGYNGDPGLDGTPGPSVVVHVSGTPTAMHGKHTSPQLALTLY